MSKTEIGEQGVADLLDQILTLNREGDLLPYEGNEQELCELAERERGIAGRLAKLKSASPAVLLAQLCYACLDQGNEFFEAEGATKYDFATVAAKAGTLERRLLARVVCELEDLAGGPVAEVIARRRELSRLDEEFYGACYHALEPFEAAATAAEGKRAAELRQACEAMRAVMVENRRLTEQLAVLPIAAE